jgi:hypothetical protein
MVDNTPLPAQGVSLAGALVGFEGRVVFYAFASYIKLPPPWNWIAVTIALFGMAAVVLAHYTGAIGTTIDATIAGEQASVLMPLQDDAVASPPNTDALHSRVVRYSSPSRTFSAFRHIRIRISRSLPTIMHSARDVYLFCTSPCTAGSFLLLCTTAGAIAAGVPINWLPAPMVGACGLVLFFDTTSLREYIVFVGGAFMTGEGSPEGSSSGVWLGSCMTAGCTAAAMDAAQLLLHLTCSLVW